MTRRRQSGYPLVSMVLACLLPAVFVLALFCGAAPAAADEFPGERYGILSERNIYRRDRAPRPPERPREATPIIRQEEPPRLYRYRLALTGIVNSGGQPLAFFEDATTRRTLRVAPGDALLAGRVTLVGTDYVVHEQDGVSRQVAVGGVLEHTARQPLPDMVAGRDPRPPPAAAAPGDVGALLEELRRRRQQELGE